MLFRSRLKDILAVTGFPKSTYMYWQNRFERENLGVYKGALYENFVAEAFVKHGLGLFYYKKDNSTLEEDFFVRTRDELIPVEVKSNNDRSKSLATLIKNENYSDIKHGIKLGDFNIGYANNIYTFPYFCAFMIKAYLKSLD